MGIESKKRFWIPLFIVALAAVIVTSQGMSFARWNEFNPVGGQFNLHANLLFLVGVAFQSICWFFWYLLREITSLKKQIETLKSEKGDII